MNLRNVANTHMELNMCMLGARGVGKTSVMTAIFDESRSSGGLVSSKVALKASDDTRTELSSKKDELHEIFDNEQEIFGNEQEIVKTGISASEAAHFFDFEMGLIGRTPCVSFRVTDYPGEFLSSNPAFVNEQLTKSSVIFIAIDSPYLMEENAQYNEARNQISLIYEYLQKNIQLISNKLILLVPLKCEKYFIENKMELLGTKIKDAYAKIIDLVSNCENVALAITPILTLGGVKFSHFEHKDSVAVAKYAFVDKEAKFSPMFCVQPIYYMLSFVAKQYMEHREDVGIFGKLLQHIYDIIDKNEDLFNEFVKLSSYRITDKFGYSVIKGEKLFL